MNMGGDDFINKPFDLRVLMAKINALLRRSYAFSAGAGFWSIEGRFWILRTARLYIKTIKYPLPRTNIEFYYVLWRIRAGW